MITLAIIGYAAVATYLTRHLDAGVTCRAVIARPGREAAARDATGIPEIVSLVVDLPPDLDCVVDYAGHSGLVAHGAAVLARGTDLITVSIGALADEGLALDAAAHTGGSSPLVRLAPWMHYRQQRPATSGGLVYTDETPLQDGSDRLPTRVWTLRPSQAPDVHFEASILRPARGPIPKTRMWRRLSGLLGWGWMRPRRV